jgi:hypothetical protein
MIFNFADIKPFNDSVMEMQQYLDQLKRNWFDIKRRDGRKEVFGAFMHHYDLNKPLSESEVEFIEKKYNFTLPVEYRGYIAKVANGGVGPFYGMYSFENSVMALNSGSLDEGSFKNHLDQNPDHFSKQFPITDEQVDAYLIKKAAGQNVNPISISKNAGGYLFLAEYGCGGYYVMPVNGNGAGEVWFLQKQGSNKLTYVLKDENGVEIQSGSYGDDEEKVEFLLTPELKFNGAQASTVNFLEWLDYRQQVWFDN